MKSLTKTRREELLDSIQQTRESIRDIRGSGDHSITASVTLTRKVDRLKSLMSDARMEGVDVPDEK